MMILSMLCSACTEKRMDDAMLTARVKAQMAVDGRISPTRVGVDTLNGAVTLSGEVPTQEEKDAAEQVAQKVEGVRSVSNQITVNPAAAATGLPSGNEMKEKAGKAVGDVGEQMKREANQAILMGKIKARLVGAGYSGIAVGVEQGVATLQGNVSSERDRDAIETIVAKMEGVEQINNQITVTGQSPTPSPTVGP
jgi:osmotically-inducible protein OsmY